MEMLRRHVVAQPSAFAAYLALQRALMVRFEARGGSAEEFCRRLAPAFHRRFAPLVLVGEGMHGVERWSEECSPRLRQEQRRAA